MKKLASMLFTILLLEGAGQLVGGVLNTVSPANIHTDSGIVDMAVGTDPSGMYASG